MQYRSVSNQPIWSFFYLCGVITGRLSNTKAQFVENKSPRLELEILPPSQDQSGLPSYHSPKSPTKNRLVHHHSWHPSSSNHHGLFANYLINAKPQFVDNKSPWLEPKNFHPSLEPILRCEYITPCAADPHFIGQLPKLASIFSHMRLYVFVCISTWNFLKKSSLLPSTTIYCLSENILPPQKMPPKKVCYFCILDSLFTILWFDKMSHSCDV